MDTLSIVRNHIDLYAARSEAESIVREASSLSTMRNLGFPSPETEKSLRRSFEAMADAFGYRLPAPSTNSQASERTFSRDDLADAAHQSAREERP